MAKNIAVIGKSDSIEYFRILGCRTWETESGELTPEQLQEVLDARCRIVFITEEVFFAHEDRIRALFQQPLPVVTVIPDIDGAIWEEGEPRSGKVAFEELRRAIVKAVGQDISQTEESA